MCLYVTDRDTLGVPLSLIKALNLSDVAFGKRYLSKRPNGICSHKLPNGQPNFAGWKIELRIESGIEMFDISNGYILVLDFDVLQLFEI